MIKERIKRFIQVVAWRFFHIYLEWRVHCIRKKETIRFLFVLQELSQWKTEMLYKAMLRHPRFDPILGIAPCLGYPGAESKVIDYCEKKGYRYIMLDSTKTLSEQIDVDIVAHQKPYSREINPAHRITKNRRIPVVYIPYYLSTITENWIVNERLCLLAWRVFIDNEGSKQDWSRMHRLKGINYAVTGLPIMDELLIPKSQFLDVWPVNDKRKRIIYAPHHTIADIHLKGIGYSTFLEYGEFMLEMKEKYRDQVYFVFKPHPLLYQNLSSYWGEDRTKAYYARWNDTGNSHIEVNDKYLALFKYSDAMIHDCGSFTIEYMYTGNPVMYLTKDSHHKDNMTPNAAHAFDLHYKGETRDDIDRFISDVIVGRDPLKTERLSFCENCLVPPYQKSASENILDAILGERGFK